MHANMTIVVGILNLGLCRSVAKVLISSSASV